jgi:ParB family chromosome partitioning protein
MSDRKRRFTVESLFTDTRPQAAGVAELPGSSLIAIDRIDPDPDQPRRTFDQDRLEELAASIQIEGVLQPIVVRYDAERDRYIVVHGERRWRASRIVGLQSIPALVRDVPAERRLIQQLMENVVRDDLNPVDRSAALRTLKTQLGDPAWETVAETVGIKRSRLFQLLSTEKLPEPIQDDLRSGRLSEKQSRALQNLDPLFQAALRDALVHGTITAERATVIARELRSLPSPADEAAALAMVTALVNHPAEAAEETVATPMPEAQQLLALLTQLAHGDERAANELATMLKGVSTTRYSPKRHEKALQSHVALLAALHAAPRRERLAAKPQLEALRDTLNAILDTL